MNPLQHIVEPSGLLLTWQPQDEQAEQRTRRVVGEIVMDGAGKAVFRYLKGTPDFAAAEAQGFKGYPAFKREEPQTDVGVIESFLRRLPPRKREDFADFLATHRLPSPFDYSDIALLGYTGARLPSDGFALVPVFPEHAVPCDFLLEVAGLRHAPSADIAQLQIGDGIVFKPDTENSVDQDALAVIHNDVRIGYVNRALKGIVYHWLAHYSVNAVIERINGKPDRPLVYVRVSVTKQDV